MKNQDFWEKKYLSGHNQHYPWDCVVSFVFNHIPKNKNTEDIKILELGCGTGANLVFIAQQGFQPFGVEHSRTAITRAKARLKPYSIDPKNFYQGSFEQLPFEDNSFDLVIDRASLCCVNRQTFLKSLDEALRVLKHGGVLFSQTYGKKHSSYLSGKTNHLELTTNISAGTLVNAGNIRFSNEKELLDQFENRNWKLISLKETAIIEKIKGGKSIHEEFAVIAEKKI